MLKTPDNVKIERAILAVARAYVHDPQFEMSKALELAARVDAVAQGEVWQHVIVALILVLLKGLGLTPRDAAARMSAH